MRSPEADVFKITLLLIAAATLIGCAAIQPELPQLGRSLDDVRQRSLEHVPAATTTRGSLDMRSCPRAPTPAPR